MTCQLCKYHVAVRLGKSNCHPAKCLPLHVDVQDSIVTSVDVNSHKASAVGHIASGWSTEGQSIVLRISDLFICTDTTSIIIMSE